MGATKTKQELVEKVPETAKEKVEVSGKEQMKQDMSEIEKIETDVLNVNLKNS